MTHVAEYFEIDLNKDLKIDRIVSGFYEGLVEEIDNSHWDFDSFIRESTFIADEDSFTIMFENEDGQVYEENQYIKAYCLQEVIREAEETAANE